jgi:hypothetical protein
LHLPAALERHPDRDLVLYNRVSTWDQAGKGKADLGAKTCATYRELRKMTSRRLRRIVGGAVESGQLSNPRPKLIAGASYALQEGLILVAADLSRFLRAEAFDHRTNLDASPTPEEFARLRAITLGVPLATVADPLLPETGRGGRRSLATKRTGRCGRPGSIDDELADRIFQDLGYLSRDRSGRLLWRTPIDEVAALYGVSRHAVIRLLRKRSPTGETWHERGLRAAAELGLLAIRELPGGGAEYVSLLRDRARD